MRFIRLLRFNQSYFYMNIDANQKSTSSHKVLLVYSGKSLDCSPTHSAVSINRKIGSIAFNKLCSSPNPRFSTPKYENLEKFKFKPLKEKKERKKKDKEKVGITVNIFSNKRLQLVGKQATKSSKLIGKEILKRTRKETVNEVDLNKNTDKHQSPPSYHHIKLITPRLHPVPKPLQLPQIRLKKKFEARSISKLPTLKNTRTQNSFQDPPFSTSPDLHPSSSLPKDFRSKSRRVTYAKVLELSNSISLSAWD